MPYFRHFLNFTNLGDRLTHFYVYTRDQRQTFFVFNISIKAKIQILTNTTKDTLANLIISADHIQTFKAKSQLTSPHHRLHFYSNLIPANGFQVIRSEYFFSFFNFFPWLLPPFFHLPFLFLSNFSSVSVSSSSEFCAF